MGKYSSAGASSKECRDGPQVTGETLGRARSSPACYNGESVDQRGRAQLNSFWISDPQYQVKTKDGCFTSLSGFAAQHLGSHGNGHSNQCRLHSPIKRHPSVTSELGRSRQEDHSLKPDLGSLNKIEKIIFFFQGAINLRTLEHIARNPPAPLCGFLHLSMGF